MSDLNNIHRSNQLNIQKFSKTLDSNGLSGRIERKISEAKLIVYKKMKQIFSDVFGGSYKEIVYGIPPRQRTEEQQIIKFQIKIEKDLHKITEEIKNLKTPIDSKKAEEALSFLTEIRENMEHSHVALMAMRKLPNSNNLNSRSTEILNERNLGALKQDHEIILAALDEQIRQFLEKTGTVEKTNSLEPSKLVDPGKFNTMEDAKQIAQDCAKGKMVRTQPESFTVEENGVKRTYAFPHQFFIDLLRSHHTKFNENFTFCQEDFNPEDIPTRNSILEKSCQMLHQQLSSPKETRVNLFDLSPPDKPPPVPIEEIIVPTSAMFTIMNLMSQGNMATNGARIEEMSEERTGRRFLAGGGGSYADLPGMWMDLSVKGDEVKLTLKCPFVLRDPKDHANNAKKDLDLQMAKREFTLSLQELGQVRPDNDKTLKTVKIKDTYSPILKGIALMKQLYEIF